MSTTYLVPGGLENFHMDGKCSALVCVCACVCVCVCVCEYMDCFCNGIVLALITKCSEMVLYFFVAQLF